MPRKQECIAMLLAGGQGSRLGVLTQQIAKPAVPYGGKYRIIDFPLSNCINSGIYTVGVLTQYQPFELNEYIGNGQPWDLDREYGGVHILQPYQKIEGSDWYTNTANAIYQNIHFIDQYNPEYVAILSGDHIYKMDYSKMLAFHKEKQAACTIAALEVPWEEASRFGVMFVNDDNSIYKFEEKPENPTSNIASMGVYIFTWEKLRDYLIADEAKASSSHDFGKDLIPAMHEAGEGLFAYDYKGYWKDVGTIDSLWEGNLDLLDPNVNLDLNDPTWKIYSRNIAAPPHYVGPKSTLQNSLVTDGAIIEGDVDFSIIFQDAIIEEGASVKDSIVMTGAHIKKGASVQYAIVAENVVVDENAVIGERPEKMSNLEDWGVAVVGSDLYIGKDVVVKPKEMVYESIEGVK